MYEEKYITLHALIAMHELATSHKGAEKIFFNFLELFEDTCYVIINTKYKFHQRIICD